jgi:hypothetical protein
MKDEIAKSETDYDHLRQEIAEGLLYIHHRLGDSTKNTLEAASFLYGLIELLNEKGLISIEELDNRQPTVAKRLKDKYNKQGNGVLLQEPEFDKYDYKEVANIDCGSRIHLCKATCCRLPFALSKQDIHEGIIHWDLGQPYIISQDHDGFCTHIDRECYMCNVREHRPVPCRAYDCSKDQTIWLDFDQFIINPDIQQSVWPRKFGGESS